MKIETIKLTLLKSSILLLSINAYTQSNMVTSFRESFFLTFFNNETNESVFDKSYMMKMDYFIGDSTEQRRDYYGDLLPQRGINFKFKIKEKHVKNLIPGKCYFQFINFFKYHHLIDSTKNLAIINCMPCEDSLIQYVDSMNSIQIEEASLDTNNIICIQYYFNKRGKKSFYLKSNKNMGEVKMYIKNRDKRFLKKKGYIINDELTDALEHFLVTMQLRIDNGSEYGVRYNLYEY